MSAGYFVWAGVRPCLKMIMVIGAGYALAKAGKFTPSASKGLSQLSIYVALPCLLFSSMVVAFDSTNISNFGTLLMLAIVYSFIGLACALITSQFCYIPHDFRYGFLVMGWTSNFGNLSNSIVETVSQHRPFNGSSDRNIGIAYSAVFILMIQVSFYGLGIFKICGWDWTPEAIAERTNLAAEGPLKKSSRSVFHQIRKRSKHKYQNSANIGSPDIAKDDEAIEMQSQAAGMQEQPSHAIPASLRTRISAKLLKGLKVFLVGAISPVTIIIPLSLIVALVNPLKALFVDVPGWSGNRVRYAPDESPPLAFVYDFAAFVGPMAIPAGLFILGGSFSRLKICRPFTQLPVAAIALTVIAKYAVRPVIGIFMVQGMKRITKLFPVEDKMLSFTAYLLSGTPSSVSQMVATSLFMPDGANPDTLAAFMGAQYAFLIIGQSIQTAISLWLVS